MEKDHGRRSYEPVATETGKGEPRGQLFGVKIPTGVEHVGLRAHLLHEAAGNLFIDTKPVVVFYLHPPHKYRP